MNDRHGRHAAGPMMLGGLAGLALAVGVAVVFTRGASLSALAHGFPERSAAPGSPSAPDGGEAAPETPQLPEADPPTPHLARGPRPASLAGTEVDGGLSVDADGHFRPDPDALALFDYFLAASGEEPALSIRQRILDAIAERLDAPAEAEAMAFLDRYLAYRVELRELAEGDAVPADLERRLQWIRELRRAHFGVDSNLLFGTQETVARIDLERRRVWQDATLEETERSARLAALEEQLPKAVREARRRASEPVRVRKEVRRLREGGADSAEVFALREAAFGTEAAERLAALDEERGAWEARLDEYRSARASLLAEMGYSPDAGLAEIDLPRADRDRLDALRREHFDDSEQPRVRLLDQMR